MISYACFGLVAGTSRWDTSRWDRYLGMTAAMTQVPTAMRNGSQRGFRFLTSSVYVPTATLPPICELLDIKEPDFYLEMSPIPNAFI